VSVPVQVLVSAPALLPAVEEVAGRAGTVEGAQALWVLAGLEDPDWGNKLLAHQRAMLAVRKHEGGFVQILLADKLADLVALAGRTPPESAVRAPWARIAIVLAEEAEVAQGGAAGLHAVHAVPHTLVQRVLTLSERERAAANLLGLLVDIARLPQAREHVARWCETYGGVRVTITQAARFQAPIVQRVLARRLAAKVADRMVQTLQQGRSSSARPNLADPPAPPEQDVEAAIEGRAADLGEGIARRIVGEGDLPSEADVQRRADLALKELPARLEDVLRRHGSDLREQALKWQAELRRWSDDNLERAGFAALPVLIDQLERWRDTAGATPLGDQDQGPRMAMRLQAPDDGEVRDAARALARARATFDDSGVLFGGWTFALSAVVAACAWPALVGFGAWRMVACGGVAVAALVAGWAVAAIRKRAAEATFQRLEAAEAACRQAYRSRWSALIRDHIAQIGHHLHGRMLRFAVEVATAELHWLRTVHDTLLDLQQQHRKPERMRLVGDTAFDSDIQLPEEFYARAESRVDPAEVFDPYDAALRAESWRWQLEFMNSEALIAHCARKYGAFAEQVPFSDRAELREAAIGPARRAMDQMIDRLQDLLPLEFGAERFVVLPKQLEDAVPDSGVGHQRVHPGLADIYAAISRPAGHGA